MRVLNSEHGLSASAPKIAVTQTADMLEAVQRQCRGSAEAVLRQCRGSAEAVYAYNRPIGEHQNGYLAMPIARRIVTSFLSSLVYIVQYIHSFWPPARLVHSLYIFNTNDNSAIIVALLS